MFSLTLLVINLVLFAYILFYGMCFLALPFVRPARGKQDPASLECVSSPITVLVPCHNEGPAIIRTVDSLIQQDYRGAIRIVILLQNEFDSSFEPLVSHFAADWKKGKRGGEIFRKNDRVVILHCTGFAPKARKLNSFLPLVETPYLAFLDADHRADHDWLSTSVQKLHGSEYAGIQSRRAPLSLEKLPQLWDSSQNHVGNELVNTTLDRAAGSVFFTGTTCVFRTADIARYRFSDCVTEDTFLSYEMLRDGARIDYNADSGSREEVSPDLHSYIARRRRWSCGHNATFFALIGSILRSSIGWRLKVASLIHGLFYTVPVAVCLLLNVYAIHLFAQYTSPIRTLVALVSLAVAMLGSLVMFGRQRSILREILVLFVWVFPQVTIFFPIPLYYSDNELFFFLTLFPYLRYFFWFQIASLLAPIVLLVSGSLRMRVLKAHQLLLVLLSYPLIFFFDLWACLLGFSDFLFGRPTWAKIQRTNKDDRLDQRAELPSWQIVSRWAGAVLVVVFLIISANDLTADANCGEADAYLVDPRVFVPATDIEWSISKSASSAAPGNISVRFDSHLQGGKDDIEIAHFIDSRLQAVSKGSSSEPHSFEYNGALGWSSHIYEAALRSHGTICKRKIPFSTVLKELRGDKLFVNGEEFLVKGIIPSFSPKQERPSLAEGLKQIKETGANTVRYYHAVREGVKEAIAEEQLLVIDQPDRSTWTDVNLGFAFSRDGLLSRFQRLVSENRDFPYSLFHTFGNELEIFSADRAVPALVELMNRALSQEKDEFFSYSTFFVFLKLPAPIYGINMLDSGETYWRHGLDTLKLLNKPFYASEFGGFVAYFEQTPLELRAWRMINYWKRLQTAGSFGLIVHQSHDNWAQPVAQGYNDPLTPDQPDDVRGLWDQNNNSKPILPIVEELFSDLEASVALDTSEQHARRWTLTLKNRRNYKLSDVHLFQESGLLADPLDFAPGQERSITVQLKEQSGPFARLTARYTTHHGLSAVSKIALPVPLQAAHPFALNPDVLGLDVSPSSFAGRVLISEELRVIFPSDWKRYALDGEVLPVENGVNRIRLRSSMEEVADLEGSRDGLSWYPIRPEDVGSGPGRVRFKLKRKYPDGALLLLAGLATPNYFIRYGNGDWKKSEGHDYREVLVNLDDYPETTADYFYLLLPRDNTVYLDEKLHPLGETLRITLEMPRVFSPPHFRIEKVS